ncbi:helix-turn-helix domain-containing protein [Reichenbachiella sp.]|uniref:helix-turn-helix domain-containing protein n=1 Tax=Reichenbachiella sp. TaxID=2184521 RepID=UPI003B590922
MNLNNISKNIASLGLFFKAAIREALDDYLNYRLPEILKDILDDRNSNLLLDSNQVRKELGGISRSTLHRLKSSGNLKSCKVHGTLKFKRSDVLAYIDSLSQEEDL